MKCVIKIRKKYGEKEIEAFLDGYFEGYDDGYEKGMKHAEYFTKKAKEEG